MKKLNFVLCVVAVIVCCCVFCSCSGDGNDDVKVFSGITFSNKTAEYDGNEHMIEISGELPNGARVAYENNKATEVGEYTAKATVTCDGYQTLVLTAKLTITEAAGDKKVFSGITFSDRTAEYDGNEHMIEVSGELPNGASVAYENNKATEVGEYTAKAIVTCDGYQTLVLTAKLTITKIDFNTSAFTFANSIVEYDGLSHGIQVVGNVPAGTVITYTYNGNAATAVTDVGTYTVVATFVNKNYNTATMAAILYINSSEEMLYSAVLNGSVYFQNNLDGQKLYVYKNGTVSKVNNDQSSYFANDGTNLFYYSGSLISQTIRQISSDGSINTVYNPGRATYLATDGTNLYYCKANAVDVKGENGIYKVAIATSSSAEMPEATRICTDKADYLAYYDGKLYYSNLSDDGKLYSISVSGNSKTALTADEVSDVCLIDGVLYYTLHETANASLCKFDTSTGVQAKLCQDNAAYICKAGNYVYYVNKDLLSSNIFGKGIYRVSVNGSTSLVGEKVLSAEDDGFYSLSSDGTNLYYYKLNDKHFYRYSPSAQTEIDLMSDFEPTDDSVLVGGAETAVYKGEIYYTNPLDYGCLYKYNPETKSNIKVLADSVADLFFNGDTMYYSTYIFTNYALWSFDLADDSAEPTKISSHRYEQLIFADDCIYAIRVGVSNSWIVKMDLDGQNETDIYKDKTVYPQTLVLLEGEFHFCIDPAIGYKYICTHSSGDGVEEATKTGIKSDKFVIYQNRYYYFDHVNNNLMSCDMLGSNSSVVVAGVDISEMLISDGVIYFTDTSDGSGGLYSYDIAKAKKVKLSDKAASGLLVYNGYLYFVNMSTTLAVRPLYTRLSGDDGDGHLCALNLSSETIAECA